MPGERRPRPLSPGEVLDASNGDALVIADRFVRGDRVLGRFQRLPAFLGVMTEPAEPAMQLTVSLVCDGRTESWWRERMGMGTAGQARLERDSGEPPIRDDDPEGAATYYESLAPRLVTMRVQGSIVCSALVASRESRGTSTTYGFCVVRIQPSLNGLTGFEFEDAARTSVVRSLGPARNSAVGLLLDEVFIEAASLAPVFDQAEDWEGPGRLLDPAVAEREGMVSTGAAGVHPGPGPRRLFSAAVVVNPPLQASFSGLLLRASIDGRVGTLRDSSEQDLVAYLAEHADIGPTVTPVPETDCSIRFSGYPGHILLRLTSQIQKPHLVRLPDLDSGGVEVQWHLMGVLIEEGT